MMRRTLVRSITGSFIVGLAILSGGFSAASAQNTPSGGQAATLTIAEFLANPGQLLQLFPHGGPQMISLVQQFVISDASSPPVIIGLSPKANPLQRSAIGQGLAQAAKVIVTTNQPRAVDIQQRVAALNDPVMNVAFTSGVGDTRLGGIGGGAGGGGGGIGGQTSQLPTTPQSTGAPQYIGSRGTSTPMFTTSSSVSGASSSSGAPVSPVRP